MYKENVIRLILDMETFMSKKGNNIESKRKLIDSINFFTKSDKLRSIYVNEVDNYLLPDIFVMPMYTKKIGTYLIDTDEVWYDNDYTIELHKRCFDKYTSEELVALILNATLQNVLSTVAKTRFLMAYDNAMAKYTDDMLLNAFDNVKFSEVAYLMFMDICVRPFVISTANNLGGNVSVVPIEILESFNLKAAFDMAAIKYAADPHVLDAEQIIDNESKMDIKTSETLLQATVRGEVRYFTDTFKTKYPLLTIKNILELKDNDTGLGFGEYIARKPATGLNKKKEDESKDSALNENVHVNEIDLQYKIDKIITAMKHAETEDERTALLYKIRVLKIELTKMIEKMEKISTKKGVDMKKLQDKIDFVNGLIRVIDDLRKEIVEMEIKPKRYGIFVKMPDGYDY